MKVVILLLSIFLLASCFNNLDKSDIDNAKKEILGDEYKTEEVEEVEEKIKKADTDDIKINTVEEENKEPINKVSKNVTVEYITGNKFIEIDDLSSRDFFKGKEKITGKTLTEVDRIEVSFSNISSDYPNDNYTLKKFKKGDETFEYFISGDFKVFDFGENNYEIRAYSGDEVSKVKVIIILDMIDLPFGGKKEDSDLFVESDTSISYEKKLMGDEKSELYLNFPKSSSFGEVLLTGENSFTYSKVDNLEVLKKSGIDITCENITEKLKEQINTWFYWNTCRDIIKDKGISFYVIRLDGDSYVYEKHYLDFNHSLYGVFQIETGKGVDKDNIGDKNKELKGVNSDFEKLETVDLLFKELLR